jgi:hypothetical protein
LEALAGDRSDLGHQDLAPSDRPNRNQGRKRRRAERKSVLLLHLKNQFLDDALTTDNIQHQFSSILIKGFGFSILNTLLVQVLTIAFQGVFVLISSCGSTYLKNTRTYFIAANPTISTAGSVMIREIDAQYRWTRFFEYCINMAFSANLPIVLSIVSSNVAGFTKKSTANSMVCLGDDCNVLFLKSSDTDRMTLVHRLLSRECDWTTALPG